MSGQGWYADPERRYALRWYDGVAWTEHVVDGGVRTTDPCGAPASAASPPPTEEDRWLPHPALPDAPRWGPFAVGVPSGGPDAVPEAGYEPVLTGNRALDVTQNYVNEFESHMRRDASLVRSAAAGVRASPTLRWVGVLLGVTVVVAFAGLLAGTASLLFDDGDPFGGFFAAAAALLLGVPLLFVTVSVVAFTAAVAAGLCAIEGEAPSARRLLGAAARARGTLGALTLARLVRWGPSASAQAGASLYEAFAVFAVPVAMAERTSLREAQARSEDLVAERWGPGRFRALGLPRTSPWSVVYTEGVERHGYKAPYLAALAFLLVLLGPLLVAIAMGDETATLAGFAWMWGAAAFGGMVWSGVVQPLLQGMLRAHLYHYAMSGEALPPFDRGALHACLREETRAGMGLPQRASPARSRPLGVGGVVRSFAADPSRFVQQESGVTSADVRAVISDARLLYKDGRLVMRALERSPAPLDAAGLLAATGLPRDRCRTAVVNLLWTGKIASEVTAGGEALFSSGRRTRDARLTDM